MAWNVGNEGMKDNNTVQHEERTLEHGIKQLKLPIFLTLRKEWDSGQTSSNPALNP